VRNVVWQLTLVFRAHALQQYVLSLGWCDYYLF
jgi:hypothetical protein